MANALNSDPIIVDTDMTQGWRASQTLNSGALPGYAFARQAGIRPQKIILQAASGSQTAGTVSVVDPTDNTVLWQAAVATGTLPANTIILREDFENMGLGWRDFKATGVTATGTKLLIYYRI